MKIQNLIFVFLFVAILGTTIFYITDKNADNHLEVEQDQFDCIQTDQTQHCLKETNGCQFNVRMRYLDQKNPSEGYHYTKCMNQGETIVVTCGDYYYTEILYENC